MGVVGVGLYLGGELGRGTALIMVVAHGVCSPIIFRYAYYLYQSTHSRLLSRCRSGLSGPVMRLLFFLLIAVNIGVPPFLNLWREVIIFTSLLPMWTGSWLAAGAAAFLGVAYGLFAFVRVTHGKESSDSRNLPRVHAHACVFVFARACVTPTTFSCTAQVVGWERHAVCGAPPWRTLFVPKAG